MPIDRETFEETHRNAIAHLLAEREPEGHWVGELSSSSLATATAITALALVDRASGDAAHAEMIAAGAAWLIERQNDDGGWGDTDKSFSNISTTMLCWGALGLDEVHAGATGGSPASALTDATSRCESWLADHAGSTDIPALVEAVMRRYGKDRTFSVPILTMCALCGRLGDPHDRATWRWVKQLPFELAALPQSFYRFVRMPVVSYALPALIAIGQVRHHHRPTLNPITRLARAITKRRTLRVLESIQPPNGGFLEATPLTSFVTMSLAACGLADSTVARRGVAFIEKSMRDDGSWPIDTDLSTWVTTLSINALAAGGKLDAHLNEGERAYLRDWLLDQQYTERHPYTGAAPGGWAWTPEPGGVPDADDTSGAVLALHNLGMKDERIVIAASAGLDWLENLQNSDGGIPTFCRGWGKLPFDRSSPDITAHYVTASGAWHFELDPDAKAYMTEATRIIEQAAGEGEHELNTAMGQAQARAEQWFETIESKATAPVYRDPTIEARHYLQCTQCSDGSWSPLWFGNQHTEEENNPTYGTTRVMPQFDEAPYDGEACQHWMLENQNADGGWGAGQATPSSIEETALAVEALAAVMVTGFPKPPATDAIERGVTWLIEHTQRGTAFEPAPIGFYFAKLWYYEKLYPVIWTVAALERVKVWMEQGDT